jgi:hypothetical protein
MAANVDIETDPFTKVYDALWDMLETNTHFTDQVKVGNRLTFTGESRDPVKPDIQAADLPEVGILPTTGKPHLERTSSSSTFDAYYDAIVLSGDRRLNVKVYPVCWALFRAMKDWHTELKTNITWNDRAFVHLARPSGFQLGLSDAASRGMGGWVARWTYEVQMHFTTTDL